MQEQFINIVQSLEHPLEDNHWLFKVLDNEPLSPETTDYCQSLIIVLQQLKLEKEYIQAALLFSLHSSWPEASEYETLIPDLVKKHYRALVYLIGVSPNLRNKEQSELFLRKLIATAKDIQLLSSLLAIRLNDLKFLKTRPQEEQHAFASMILGLYAPLAERLGIFGIKAELEDDALRYVEPASYAELKKKVARKREERSELVEKVLKEIDDLMNKVGIEHEVQGRYKRFFSIFQKLKKVNNNFDRIQDLTAFRVLVPSVQDCYKALSYIHEHWTPKKGRYKDYISNPKPNGYQSLHTTVLDAKKETIEIQIRTYEMHEIAEFGVAAHWQYKGQSRLNQKDAELYNKLQRQIKSTPQGGTGLPSIDLLSGKIFVQTPMNDIVELPEQATAVDFAYAIHTKIGNSVVAAKVNGSIVKLDDPLSNGDTVEVTTSTKQVPRKEWLSFVKTTKAKHKIRHAIRLEEREANKEEGWKILEKTFKTYQLNLNRVLKDGQLERMTLKQRNQSLEHLLCAIGEGQFKPENVAAWFIDDPEIQAQMKPTPAPKKKKPKASLDKKGNLVIVDGMDHMLTRFAKCCSPQKGDKIMGYLTHGRGVTVHKESCPSLLMLDPDRRIYLEWNSESSNSAVA